MISVRKYNSYTLLENAQCIHLILNSLVKKLVDSERNQRKMKDELEEVHEKCYLLELEKNKLIKTIDKLKLKCKKSEDEAKKILSNGVNENLENQNGEPCSLYCCCHEKDIISTGKPQRLQKCYSFKVGTDVERETTVLASSEMHSTKLNYLYEGEMKKNNHDIFGQSNNHKSSSGASFSSFPPLNNDCSDNNYSTKSAVKTDDGVHKLCITTTDGLKAKVSKDRKFKEQQHSKFMMRKNDENNRNQTNDYNQRNGERNITSSKNSRNLVQAYVGGSGDSGLSLEESSSPSSSNKVSPHSNGRYETSGAQHSPDSSASSSDRPRRSFRLGPRQSTQNHVIENDEDEFIVIPSLRREDDESSSPLTSEGSVTDENEEKGHSGSGEDNNKTKPKILESFRTHSRIRRIDDEDDDDEEDDDVTDAPIYQHYYERNLMLEEATTVGAEQISIGSLKRQFAVPDDKPSASNAPSLPTKLRSIKHRKSSSGSNDEGMVMDGDRFSSSGSNKSARSRNTSSSTKSLKQMEDEFSSEIAENEHRTVSRKSIVSRNSIVFSESIDSEDDKASENEENGQESHFTSIKVLANAPTKQNDQEYKSIVHAHDRNKINENSDVRTPPIGRTSNSKLNSFIQENFFPSTNSTKPSPPTYSGAPKNNEKLIRNESFSRIQKNEENLRDSTSPEVSKLISFFQVIFSDQQIRKINPFKTDKRFNCKNIYKS